MQYRIDRLNNIYIRLNDDGSTLMIKLIYSNGEILKITRVLSYQASDWDLIYNNYSHSNKREFDEAEKLARI